MPWAVANEYELLARGGRELSRNRHTPFGVAEIDVVPAFIRAGGDEQIFAAQKMHTIPENEMDHAEKPDQTCRVMAHSESAYAHAGQPLNSRDTDQHEQACNGSDVMRVVVRIDVGA